MVNKLIGGCPNEGIYEKIRMLQHMFGGHPVTYLQNLS